MKFPLKVQSTFFLPHYIHSFLFFMIFECVPYFWTPHRYSVHLNFLSHIISQYISFYCYRTHTWRSKAHSHRQRNCSYIMLIQVSFFRNVAPSDATTVIIPILIIEQSSIRTIRSKSLNNCLETLESKSPYHAIDFY